MDYSATAKEILQKVDGEDNIVNVSHCMTRLRLTLKDESMVNDEEVKAIKGAAGIMKKAGQYQIAFLILGPIGSFIGGGLANLLVLIQTHVSIAAYVIMAAAMPLKRPLAAVCISSGITGLIAGFMNVSASSFASPSLLALPIFVHAEKSNNFAMAAVCAAIAIVLTFVVTWVMGFQDPDAE